MQWLEKLWWWTVGSIQYMRARRKDLAASLSIWTEFERWEETCVPSYCHPNVLAAWVSWSRLFSAVALARKLGAKGPVLDFGASIGELGRLVDPSWSYHFIEQDDLPARYLEETQPTAIRQTLDTAPANFYGCVMALDSLEHNEDYELLLERLAGKLGPHGCLIISGPTENPLYRLGRRIAGFDAHYHVTNISMIESAAARRFELRERVRVPLGLPLFNVSGWSAKQ
jgi:hypothetical protein